MSTFTKWNRTSRDRERQYWGRGGMFSRKVEYDKNDHRNAEDGLTDEGLPAWQSDGRRYYRARPRGGGMRPRTPERIVVGSHQSDIRRFALRQTETRSAFNWARSTRPGVLRQLWRHLRNH